MADLYNRAIVGITYEFQDEILETGFSMGTAGEDLNGAWSAASYSDVLDWLGDVVIPQFATYSHESVTYRCLSIYPIFDPNARSRHRIITYPGEFTTSGVMPANCPLVVGFRGNRGPKFVFGGLRLSILPKEATVQGVIADDYRADVNDEMLGPLKAGFTPFDVDSLYQVGIFGDHPVQPFISADFIYCGPVVGSMRERTGNRPQRRKKPVVTP